MDYFVAFLLMVSMVSMVSVVSTEKPKSTKVQKRVKVLENRVNKLETRLSEETSNLLVEMADVSEKVIGMNDSFNQLEAVCRNGHQSASSNRVKETTETKTIPPVSRKDTEQRLMTAFSDEKVKVKAALDRIDQHLEEINDTSIRITSMEIQTLRSDYDDLKRTVEIINTTIADVKEELLSLIETTSTEVTQNISLSTVQLKQLVLRIDKIEKEQMTMGETLNEIKQDFNERIKDSTTTSVNKYECPALWSQYGQFCYRYFNDNVVYSEAQRVCADNGASVVDLLSQAEADFVKGLVGYGEYWIGLTDIEEKGTWIWDRTNSEASFTIWKRGQPNSWGGEQDCVVSELNNQWNDWGCKDTDIHGFVCKKSL